ncbi:MAG TPA: SDR family NAD(P)-dependent oxidoreductase [Melioribacteraceae bacterium]|nr:SDR family NAD(P)-dependent oxidoreductase [Melioribacteraceae bacterium]
MENVLKNWVIITGASSGIGKSFADKFANMGYNLILIARNIESLLQLKQKYLLNNIKTEIIVQDLSKKEWIKQTEDLIKDKRIDYLINNAGFGLTGEFISQNINTLEDMINVNCLTVVLLTKIVLPNMLKFGKGNIIIIGSLLSFVPSPYNTVYAATKSFDEMLACGLWYELKKYNINVISVNPGTTRTNFHERAGLTMNKFYRNPEDVVNTALKYLGKKPTVIDGFFNKTVLLIKHIVTRKIFIKLSGIIFNKMQKLNET